MNVLADGAAAWIWKQARPTCRITRGYGMFYHLLEHLHDTGRGLHGEGSATRAWTERQRAWLFRDGAGRYLREGLLPQLQTRRRAAP